MSALALNDEQRHAFAAHLDRVGMSRLVGRKPASQCQPIRRPLQSESARSRQGQSTTRARSATPDRPLTELQKPVGVREVLWVIGLTEQTGRVARARSRAVFRQPERTGPRVSV
jgi:hypothetical protein